MKSMIFLLLATLGALQSSLGHAAVGLDRTRVIYNEEEKSSSLSIKNNHKTMPFLAQAWLENKEHKKEGIPFAVLPPLQRIEANSDSVVRIEKMASAADLPQDRESVFYFNLREIPPKSDKPNVMQIAMQTQIKMFYRPKGLMVDSGAVWQDKLILHKTAAGFNVENPTAYHITVTGFAEKEGQDSVAGFDGFMVEPKSSLDISLKNNKLNNFILTYINDFGGHVDIKFLCSNNVCSVNKIN